MSESSTKAPKPEKLKPQSAERRQEALRYNQMMYGPTSGERRPVVKKVDYGAPYLAHPKFVALMHAFKSGTEAQFSVTFKEQAYPITTDGTHILFDGKVVFYTRPLNKYERHLLVDRAALMQYQGIDPFVHLVFAVLRSIPEATDQTLTYQNAQFWNGAETLDIGIAQHGPNLMMGVFRIVPAKAKQR